jgi:hypothetical protein
LLFAAIELLVSSPRQGAILLSLLNASLAAVAFYQLTIRALNASQRPADGSRGARIASFIRGANGKILLSFVLTPRPHAGEGAEVIDAGISRPGVDHF